MFPRPAEVAEGGMAKGDDAGLMDMSGRGSAADLPGVEGMAAEMRPMGEAVVDGEEPWISCFSVS